MLASQDDSIFGALTPFASAKPPLAGASPVQPAPAPQRGAAGAMIAPAQAAAPVAAQPQADPITAYLHAARAHESGGNDQVVNNATGATGRYQFLPSTWASVSRSHPELGLRPEDIYNGEKQDAAMRAFTSDNAGVLKQHGLETTPANLFMLSFLGPGAGPKFLKQMIDNPAATAAQAFPQEAKYNAGVFYQTDPHGKPIYDRPRSLSQVYQMMTKTFGGSGVEVPPTGAPQAPQAPVQVAQGPQTTMTDAGGGASAPPAELPRGLTPITSAPPAALPVGLSVPPPPPIELPKGLTAITPGGGYTTDASGHLSVNPVQPKPMAPGSQDIVGVNMNGEPIFADPKQQEEYDKAKIGTVEAFGAGAAEDVTGAAEWLPGSLGAGAARASEALKGSAKDYPMAEAIGRFAPFALPYGTAAKAIGEGVKAATEGADLLGNMWRGAKVGGLTTGAQAAVAPTGEQDTGKRLGGKTMETLTGTAVGVALGGAGSAAIYGAGKILDFGQYVAKAVTGVYGREAKEAAEAVTSGISAETGKAMSAEEGKAAEAALQQQAAQAAQAEHDAEFAKATKAADDIAKRFAAREITTPEELGRQIHEAAVKDVQTARATREAQSGFAAAVKSDGGAPSVPTKAFIGRVNEAEKRAVGDQAKATLSWLRDELRTPSYGGAKNISSVSIERARRIIQNLDAKIDGVATDEKHELIELKKDFVEQLEASHPALKAASKRYADLSRPLDPYERAGVAKKTALEDPYSGDATVDSTRIVGMLLNRTEGGADVMARLVRQNPEMMDSVRGYLSRQLKLAAGDKPVPDANAFNRFLETNRLVMDRVGMDVKTPEEAARAFDPNSYEAVRDKVRQAYLEIGGRPNTRVFLSDIRAKLPDVPKDKVDEVLRKMHLEDGSHMSASDNPIELDAARKAGGLDFKGEPMSTLHITKDWRGPAGSEPAPQVSPKSSEPPLFKEFAGLKKEVDQSRAAVETAAEKQKTTQTTIDDMAKTQVKAVAARRDFKAFRSALDNVAPEQAVKSASSAVEKLHKSGYITDEQLDQFNREIEDARVKFKTAEEAKSFIHRVVWPAVVAASTFAGLGGAAELFSHRIRP